MDAIGDLEWKLLYALIPGGLTGELGNELQEVLGTNCDCTIDGEAKVAKLPGGR